MRVTFRRVADHVWSHVLIERDDGVAYTMRTGPLTAETPHDLVHYTVEDALRVADGIWGSIAGGVVFRSMTHVSGRRPPHAAERSAELIRMHRDRLQRAEHIGGFVERAAHVPDAELARFVAAEPIGAISRDDLPTLDQIAAAVRALRRAEERWRSLSVGAELVLNWPGYRRLPALVSKRSARR